MQRIGEIGAFGISEMHLSALAFVPDHVPRLLRGGGNDLRGIGHDFGREVLAPKPGDLLIAEVSRSNRPALPVDEQVVALTSSKLLDSGDAFPTTRVFPPMRSTHGDFDFVCMLESPLATGVNPENFYGCPAFPQRGRNGADDIMVVQAINRDEDTVALFSAAVANSPQVR